MKKIILWIMVFSFTMLVVADENLTLKKDIATVEDKEQQSCDKCQYMYGLYKDVQKKFENDCLICLKSKKDKVQNILMYSYILSDDKRYEEDIRLLTEALKRYKENKRLKVKLAESYTLSKKFSKALKLRESMLYPSIGKGIDTLLNYINYMELRLLLNKPLDKKANADAINYIKIMGRVDSTDKILFEILQNLYRVLDNEKPIYKIKKISAYEKELFKKKASSDMEDIETWISTKPKELQIKLNKVFNHYQNMLTMKRGKIIDKKGNVLAQGSDKNRVYPQKGMTVHTIGYIGFNKKTDSFVGRTGLEKKYEYNLKHNQEIVVNIDLALQEKIVEFFGDKSGVAIVMKTNGEILSAVSLPSYDPSLFVKGISTENWKSIISNFDHPFTNKISSGFYPPTSTIKMGVALALNNSKNIDENITCKGFIELEESKHKFKCWKKSGHGEVSLRKAIQESCDVYFYKKALKSDIDIISKGLKKMGLGVKTGIDLPRERKGVIPSKAWKLKRFNKPWYRGETLIASIGQGYSLVTPIQLARYTAFLATGKLPTPHVVHKVVHRVIKPEYKEVEDINKSILEEVRKGMYDVCNRENGTANGQFSKLPIKVAGKTGTIPIFYLPKFEEKRMTKEEKNHYMLSHKVMVSYAPYGKPKYVVVVLVEHDEANESSAMVISSKIHEWMDEQNEK